MSATEAPGRALMYQREAFARAIELRAGGALDVGPMIGGRMPSTRAAEWYGTARRGVVLEVLLGP